MVRPGRISLFIGMVTGAITGLLFAPSKGEELRKNIAKERQAGGIGHMAIAQDISKMANELGSLLQKAAHSNEAKKLWMKTSDTVEQWTGGSVELDQWTKEAHTKLAQLGQAVNKYADQQRHLLTGAKKIVKKAKSAAKKAKSKAQTMRSAAQKTTPDVKKKKAPTKKATPSKKPASLKKSSAKSTSKKKK